MNVTYDELSRLITFDKGIYHISSSIRDDF